MAPNINRGLLFKYPHEYKNRNIKIVDDFNNTKEFKDTEGFKFLIFNNLLNINLKTDNCESYLPKLRSIQQGFKLKYGSFNQELPEQLLSVRYIKPEDKVLELGGNIGRNSLIISKILNSSRDLVVLESSDVHIPQLTHNRDNNKLNFQIEPSALSKRRLKQKRWVTEPDSEGLINIISWKELKEKYNQNFNVLVCDCEGCLNYILEDDPEILHDFKTIIIENDFRKVSQKDFIDSLLIKNRFKLIYNRPLERNKMPCSKSFFQVWTRIQS